MKWKIDNGMEWKMECNGREKIKWNGMEWEGKENMEWNGKEKWNGKFKMEYNEMKWILENGKGIEKEWVEKERSGKGKARKCIVKGCRGSL